MQQAAQRTRVCVDVMAACCTHQECAQLSLCLRTTLAPTSANVDTKRDNYYLQQLRPCTCQDQ
jgi:hypothetical protein